jgi:hypothetical protein
MAFKLIQIADPLAQGRRAELAESSTPRNTICITRAL